MNEKATENGITTPERRVVDMLIGRGMRIAFAESCTGGLAAAGLVSVPDASRVLDVSFVTYSNDMKVKYLGVREDSISAFGVVSEQVAGEMARGVCLASGADVGVGVSGIAGPGGATPKKPVGTVCFGFCIGGEVTTLTARFGDIGRNNVRKKSVELIYERLIALLSQEK